MNATDAPPTIDNAKNYARAYEDAHGDVINFFRQPLKDYIAFREATDQYTDDERMTDWHFDTISNSGFIFFGESINDNHRRYLTIPYAFFEDRQSYDNGAKACLEAKAIEQERLRKSRLQEKLVQAKAQVEALTYALNN